MATIGVKEWRVNHFTERLSYMETPGPDHTLRRRTI
jgi:hypothetical protein